MTRPARPAAGFTMVSALFLLVVLAVLGAALARVSLRQHVGSALELDEARAHEAALAGLEWAAFQVLRQPAPPAAAPACFGATSFSPGGALARFTVTVQCTRTPGSGVLLDGATPMVFFQLRANACNAPAGGTCPTGGTPEATYVERELSWTVSR
jgi:MSHA biogenesis protein MshP